MNVIALNEVEKKIIRFNSKLLIIKIFHSDSGHPDEINCQKRNWFKYSLLILNFILLLLQKLKLISNNIFS